MKNWEKEQIEAGKHVLARVKIMGSRKPHRSGCGWKYTWYEADKSCASGYKYAGSCTCGMYPNRRNTEYSRNLEDRYAADGFVIVYGRPHQRKNAPMVK